MSNELYADGVSEITVTGSIVRIDFMSLSATERDDANKPVPTLRQRIIMPVEAFANTVDLMQKALGGLVDAGAVRRIGEVGQLPNRNASAPQDANAGQRGRNASPNFMQS